MTPKARAQSRESQVRQRDKAKVLLGLMPAPVKVPKPRARARPDPGFGQDARGEDLGGSRRTNRFGIGPDETVAVLMDMVKSDLTTPHARAAAARTLAEISGLIGKHAVAPSRGATADVADLDRADLVRELERLRARVAAPGEGKGDG
jgi:hypothetical protein